MLGKLSEEMSENSGDCTFLQNFDIWGMTIRSIHTCLIFFLVPAEKPRQVLLMVTVETQEHKQIHRQWYTATSALFYCPKLVTYLAQYQSPRVPQRYGGSEELTPSIQSTSMIGKFGNRAVRWWWNSHLMASKFLVIWEDNVV